MAAIVRIPTPLRPMAAGRDQVPVDGTSIREVLDNLEAECQGLGGRLRTENGEVRRFVNLFLNEQDIRTLAGMESAVRDGDVITIVPAIAGGQMRGA